MMRDPSIVAKEVASPNPLSINSCVNKGIINVIPTKTILIIAIFKYRPIKLDGQIYFFFHLERLLTLRFLKSIPGSVASTYSWKFSRNSDWVIFIRPIDGSMIITSCSLYDSTQTK
ncbi:hypothetical protein ANABIO4_28140 [Bacillus subtilis]|nr:hypothetical protein ANABIO4_28140 [Bacillus subtilis]